MAEEAEKALLRVMSGGVEPELDTAALVRATPTKRLKNEPIGKFLGRITHLSLNGKGLSRVDYLAHCPNVRVLYLFENRLTGLEGLEACPLVTHLYLQNNSLTDTDGMAALTHLTKLYLDDNKVSRVSGLDAIPTLQELHLANQGVDIVFEPSSLRAMQTSLRVLNLCGNRISSLEPFTSLMRLEDLNLSRNQLSEVADVCALVGRLRFLKKLDCRENPVCTTPKYWERVVMASSSSLELLDDKPISAKQREFMARHEMHKKSLSSRDVREPVAEPPVVPRVGIAAPSAVPSVGGFRHDIPRASAASSAAAVPPRSSHSVLGSGLPAEFEAALPGKRSVVALKGGGSAHTAMPPRSLSAANSRGPGGVLSYAGRSMFG